MGRESQDDADLVVIDLGRDTGHTFPQVRAYGRLDDTLVDFVTLQRTPLVPDAPTFAAARPNIMCSVIPESAPASW